MVQGPGGGTAQTHFLDDHNLFEVKTINPIRKYRDLTRIRVCQWSTRSLFQGNDR